MLNINIIDYIYSDFMTNYEIMNSFFNLIIIVEQIARHFSNQQKIR